MMRLGGHFVLGWALGDYSSDLAAVGLHPSNPDVMYDNLQQFLRDPAKWKQQQQDWRGPRDSANWWMSNGVAQLQWPFHHKDWMSNAPQNDAQIRVAFKIPAGTSTEDFLRSAYSRGQHGAFPKGVPWVLARESWDGGGGFDLFKDVLHTNPPNIDVGKVINDIGNGINQGVNEIGKDLQPVLDAAKVVLQDAEGVVSLIPGIGTGVAAAIAAGLALLEGGSPLDIAIEAAFAAIPGAAAIPGLHVVVDAAKSIIDMGGDFVKGLERLLATELSKLVPDNIKQPATELLTNITPIVLDAVQGHISGGNATDAIQKAYAAMNPSPDVKQALDPVIGAVTDIIKTGDALEAVVTTLRTGFAAALPAGTVRDMGLQLWDTLAHLVVQAFGSKPSLATTDKSGKRTPIPSTSKAHAAVHLGMALKPHPAAAAKLLAHPAAPAVHPPVLPQHPAPRPAPAPPVVAKPAPPAGRYRPYPPHVRPAPSAPVARPAAPVASAVKLAPAPPVVRSAAPASPAPTAPMAPAPPRS